MSRLSKQRPSRATPTTSICCLLGYVNDAFGGRDRLRGGPSWGLDCLIELHRRRAEEKTSASGFGVGVYVGFWSVRWPV